MKRNIKGFYTVETAVMLPIMIVAILTVGYFIRVQGVWENIINGAVDETQYAAQQAYDKTSSIGIRKRVKDRIQDENKNIDELKVIYELGDIRLGEGVNTYRIKARINLPMPLGMEHDFKFDAPIKYRDFIGKHSEDGMGRLALETESSLCPVTIFPREGEKYHSENCTYVKATVKACVLTGQLKQNYGACGICKSKELPLGTIVYCFKNVGTAYHKVNCNSIKKFTIVMDRNEAIKKGYTPCSKCGGK